MFNALLVGYLLMQFLINLSNAIHKMKKESLELSRPLFLLFQGTAILDRIQLLLSKLEMLLIELVYLLLEINQILFVVKLALLYLSFEGLVLTAELEAKTHILMELLCNLILRIVFVVIYCDRKMSLCRLRGFIFCSTRINSLRSIHTLLTLHLTLYLSFRFFRLRL